MIKAVIFDFDGTIIDTETAWYLVFKEAYEDYGVELQLETYAQCLGTNLNTFNPYTYLATDCQIPLNIDEFRTMIQQNYAKTIASEQIRPGILQLLQAAKKQKLKIGLATSSHQDWIDKFIEPLGLDHYFECYCTADTVTNVKPHPELYEQALKTLNVQPHEAIAIEDSPNGAKAAVAAGLHTIVIPNTLTSQLPFGTGHHTIETLQNVTIDQLIDLCKQNSY